MNEAPNFLKLISFSVPGEIWMQIDIIYVNLITDRYKYLFGFFSTYVKHPFMLKLSSSHYSNVFIIFQKLSL